MNIKKNQQSDFKNNSFIFISHFKECYKLIICNFFLSLGFFFLLFKIIQILSVSQDVPFYLTDMAEDNLSKIIGGVIFSVFLLLFSIICIFWLRYKALNTLSKQNFDFFVWNFYFSFIPIFGLIYLFIWIKVMKKKYLIKTKYSLYHSLFSLIIINMLVIVAYWMIYLIKGGISYINIGNVLSDRPFYFAIPTIFDLFILPVKSIIGWLKIFNIKPAFSDAVQHDLVIKNETFCILLLLLVICYCLVASTTTFDAIINQLILKAKGDTKWIIILPMIVVCLLSHFLGMYHEIIVFYPIYGKFLLLLGFDLLTVFYVFFFPMVIGYGTSLFNPLIVNVLKIEINPWLELRAHIQFFLLVSLLAVAIFFILNYAKKILNHPIQSLVYDATIATKNNIDFLQKNLDLTEKKIKNFRWFVFAIFLLLVTNHNWLHYFFDDFSYYVGFLSSFFFWIAPPLYFAPHGEKYELDDIPLIESKKYLYLRTNYWIIVCYCVFFIIFNYKEINWQNFTKNFKKFIPFIIATILCKAIEINFLEHGLFILISRKYHDFILIEPFELKTIIFAFLIFIGLVIMVNPSLGSGGILFGVVNSALIVKRIGCAVYYHAFLSSTIIVNLLSPTSLLLPFLIHHKISYSAYIKSSWKLILSLIFVILIFILGHKYLWD